MHVVRLVGVVGHDVEERFLAPIARISTGPAWRIAKIIRRDEAEQIANTLQTLRFGIAGEMRDTGFRRVCVGASELLHCHVFVCYRFYNVGPRHEHVRRAAHHVGEISDRR